MTDAFCARGFMPIEEGGDFVTPDGEIIANGRLTTAPPAPRSYAYMTATLFRESFAEYVKGVDLLYHESTLRERVCRRIGQRNIFTVLQDKQAQMAVLAGVKHLLLGHFSSRYPDPTPLLEQAREIFPNTDLCYDGAVFRITCGETGVMLS